MCIELLTLALLHLEFICSWSDFNYSTKNLQLEFDVNRLTDSSCIQLALSPGGGPDMRSHVWHVMMIDVDVA